MVAPDSVVATPLMIQGIHFSVEKVTEMFLGGMWMARVVFGVREARSSCAGSSGMAKTERGRAGFLRAF